MAKCFHVKLNKGHQRKLEALRKSLGDEIAHEAFTKWMKQQANAVVKDDLHVMELKKAVEGLVKKGLKIPPSGIKITKSRHGITINKIEMKKPEKPPKLTVLKSGKQKKPPAKPKT